jgi:hypothetical protein
VDNPICAFAAQARSYCSFIEDSPASNSWIFAQDCLAQLLRLYELALQLPEVAPESDDLSEPIQHETWNAVRENIAKRLAPDFYWEVFEPHQQDPPEPIAGSLSDDLADIWRDLKPGVELVNCETKTSTSDAV